MSDQPDDLVLRMLRRMDVKLDRLADDVGDLKLRMSSVEAELGRVHIGLAGVHSRMDRMEVRFDRIERRLDLIDEPHPA